MILDEHGPSFNHQKAINTGAASALPASENAKNDAQNPTSIQTLQVLQARFDALGRRTQSLDSAARITHHQYDSAGRPLGVADGQGYRSQLTLDTEGRTRVAGCTCPARTAPPNLTVPPTTGTTNRAA